jgi:hypothetical protein
MRLIERLDDACHVEAVEAIASLCREIEEEIGEKPSIDEFCEFLAMAIWSTSADLFSDVNQQTVSGLKPVLSSRRKVVLRPGDVVAVPRPQGGFYFVVFLGDGFAGPGFGLLTGHSLVARLGHDKPVQAGFKYPVYSDIRPIMSGRWRIVGNDERLLSLFPGGLEVLFPQVNTLDSGNIGPFGSVRSPSGELRHLTRKRRLSWECYLQDSTSVCWMNVSKDSLRRSLDKDDQSAGRTEVATETPAATMRGTRFGP